MLHSAKLDYIDPLIFDREIEIAVSIRFSPYEELLRGTKDLCRGVRQGVSVFANDSSFDNSFGVSCSPVLTERITKKGGGSEELSSLLVCIR